MKRILIFLIHLMMGMTSCAWAEESDADAPRILVAYFSRAGENYNVGVTDPSSASASYAGYIEKGNTAIVAEIIAELTSGDLFEITTMREYPADYATMLTVAQEEYNDNARPELSSVVENMDDYDVVFLGYPNWWNTLPMPVVTFLTRHDWTGKRIIPFSTSGGSGLGRSVEDLKKYAPGANIAESGTFLGHAVAESQQEIVDWVKKAIG